ncbi:MAG: response regulator transcription factor [Bacillota bacterium]
MTKVLILDDEASIRGFVHVNLKRNGFEVIEAESGEQALQLVKLHRDIAIALLDVMLPGIDGLAVCQELRSYYPAMGIIMLTARGQDPDKVAGLSLGADDYVVKPFSPTELVARVQALWRRLNTVPTETTQADQLASGPFVVCLTERTLYKASRPIALTPRELQIIVYLIEHEGQAVSRDQLLNEIWGTHYVGDPKVVDVNMRRIREKIEDDPASPHTIETIWGHGYRWRRGSPCQG